MAQWEDINSGWEDAIPVSKETSIPQTKQDVINQEADIATNRILLAKQNIDKLGLSEEDKLMMIDRYDLALTKIQDNKIDKQRKEEEYIQNQLKYEATKLTPEQQKERIYNVHTGATEALLRGGAELPLGLANLTASLVETPINAFKNDDEKVNYFSNAVNKWIIDNKQGIIDAINKSGQEQDSFNTAKLGETIATMIPGGIIGKIAGFNRVKTLAGVEGATGALTEAGKANVANGTITPTTKEDVAMAGALSAGASYAGAKTLNALGNMFDGLSYEAREMIKQSNLTPEETKFILKDVPKDKQAQVLAGALGDEFKGNYSTVLKRSDDLKRKVRTEINQRSKAFEEALNMNDFNSLEYNAKSMFDSLNKSLAESGHTFDATGLTDNVTRLKTLTGKNDPTANILDELEGAISLNPTMTAEDIMNKRIQVNKLIGKYQTSGNKDAERVALELKQNIDNQIESSFPDELKTFVKDSLDKYQIYKEQETIKNVLEANVYKAGSGQATEKLAYDYGKISKQLEDEGLLTEEARQSLNLIQKMNYKYGGDFSIFKKASTKGESESGGVLGLTGLFVNMVKKPAFELLNLRAGKEYSIQDAIAKGIQNSDSGVDFIRSISVNKDLPKDIRKSLIENLGNIETRSPREENLVRMIKKQYGIR